MNEANKGFQIFRASEAKDLMDAGCLTVEPFDEIQYMGMANVVNAGFLEGEETRVLINMPGFSLTYVWFKNNYPLPRHSHNADCMYFIVAGSLRIGTEVLGARDCFFIPANVPYTYTPGPDGVEVLEMRHSTAFNFVNMVDNEAWWKKAADICASHREEWKNAVRPSERKA